MRVGLSPTPRIVTSASGCSAAATSHGGRRREVTRDSHVERSRPGRSAQRRDEPVAADVDAGRREHPLGVVARRPGRGDDRLAVGRQPGQRGRTEELRARDGEVMAHGGEPLATDDGHRRAAVGRRDVRAGSAQERGDAFHRPRPQRVVAVQRHPQWESGERTGQQTHRRARVAAVEHGVARWHALQR